MYLQVHSMMSTLGVARISESCNPVLSMIFKGCFVDLW